MKSDRVSWTIVVACVMILIGGILYRSHLVKKGEFRYGFVVGALGKRKGLFYYDLMFEYKNKPYYASGSRSTIIMHNEQLKLYFTDPKRPISNGEYRRVKLDSVFHFADDFPERENYLVRFYYDSICIDSLSFKESFCIKLPNLKGVKLEFWNEQKKKIKYVICNQTETQFFWHHFSLSERMKSIKKGEKI